MDRAKLIHDMKNTFTLLILATALPLAAQTSTPAKPAVHRATSTAHSATSSTASHCSVALPLLSAKIPAMPLTAPKCPAVGYQLSWIDTQIGTGELAAPKKWYTVHYTGYLPDGTKFDSSVDRNDPISFPYGAHRVITGWDTGFDGMRTGGKRRLFVPYQLAYGEAGRPPVIPEKSMLIFDVEFISQSDTQPVPKGTSAAPVTPQPGTATPAPKPATAPSSTSPAPSPAGATTTTPSGAGTAPATSPKP
jgi:peptidylprolyl isomerase